MIRRIWRQDRLYKKLVHARHWQQGRRLSVVLRCVPALFLWGAPAAIVLTWTSPDALLATIIGAVFWGASVAAAFSRAQVEMRFDPFLALRMPSAQAVVVARWLRLLPWYLWVGFCWAASLGLGAASRKWSFDYHPVALLGVGLTPLATGAVSGFQRFWEPHGIRLSARIASVFALLLAYAGTTSMALLLLMRAGPPNVVAWLLGLYVPALAFLFLVLQYRLARTGIDVFSRPFTWDEEQPLRFRAAASPQLPRTHAGRRSLWAAGGQILRARYRARGPLGILRTAAVIVWDLRAPLAAILVVALSAGWANGFGAACLYFVFSAPVHLATKAETRLYLLGVDCRAQDMHDLKAYVFTAAVPVLGAALFATLAFGPTPARWDTVVLLAAILLFRAGMIPVWYVAGRHVILRILLLATFAALAYDAYLMIASGGRLLWPAALLGLLGTAGIVAYLEDLREPWLRDRMRALVEHEGLVPKEELR